MSKIKSENAYSHLGGQAVLEGVMMRNAVTGACAVAVRLEDGSISVSKYSVDPESQKGGVSKIPVIRGVVAFIDSLVTGMKAMNIAVDLYAGDDGADEDAGQSADLEILEEFESETTVEPTATAEAEIPEHSGSTTEPDSPAGSDSPAEVKASSGTADKEKKRSEKKKVADPKAEKAKKEAGEQAMSALVTILALGIGVFLFIILPFLIVSFLKKYILNESMLAIIEGVIRVVIFVLYVLAISLVKDIRRTFGYHGAEHKCINCLEQGMELTLENVRTCKRAHRRCGTSFLILVMLVSVVVFFFIRVDNYILRIVLRLLLIPVIAGISYEIIRLSSRVDNAFTKVLSAPGLLLQKLTVREPDDGMIEAGIASVEAVIDWKEFIKENFGRARTPEEVSRKRKKADVEEEMEILEEFNEPAEETETLSQDYEENDVFEENRGILKEAEDILAKAGIPEPESDAFILFKHITGMSREDLLKIGDSGVSATNRTLFMELVGRRATREPVQLITGEAPFMGFDFVVRPGVLIPRFDTEILVEEAMKNTGSGTRILDLCTGTGCVLISILRYSNDTSGVGVDISGDAIALAAENSKDLLENGRVAWIQGDLFDAVSGEEYSEAFEMITANPPYIRHGEIQALMPEVRDYEPAAALDGGEDGLDFYRKIIPGALKYLKQGGFIFLEVGYDQAQDVVRLLQDNGYTDAGVTKDYSGNDRVVYARKRLNDAE